MIHLKLKTPFFMLEIEPLFLISVVLTLVSEQVRILLMPFFVCYLFILFHEMSHMFVASLIGKKVEILTLSIAGVHISFEEKKYCTAPVKTGKKQAICEILIYVAGPLSNFLLAGLFYQVAMIWQVNLFLGLLNLLPIYPLDGYQILRQVLCFFSVRSSYQDIIIEYIHYLFFAMLLSFAILQLLVYHSISIFIFVIYVYVIKMSQKEEKQTKKKLPIFE